ncbi:acetoacetyl-CoA thiolase [Nadsonia fulvescens var. elongata DSM 6958]|uniref:acetyl-CoA C-acetyltransferase n=1 Tax=Nadsonia fulvescens var. elongata DSM 6958 TaxID=857566 RepID=A0A1E3PQL0_9ASCO|nr:acetoacetyl-CoA thiolase [Nadsonia fulvescens var. elongata DSM 6958]
MSLILKRSFSSSVCSRQVKLNPVYILSGARTPIGAFNGSLKSISAVELGTIAVKAAVERAGLANKDVQELYMGQVLQGNVGQSPARQVVIKAGLPESTEATTINKVCSSSLKAVSIATQSIQVGDRDIIVAGGMESMSNSPFYLSRGSLNFGDVKATDSIIKDGLWDVYNNIHMGNCAENTVKREKITREQQDAYAIESYQRAIKAQREGLFNAEIIPVEIKSRNGTSVISEDESPKTVRFDKIPTLKPVFDKQGTVTAANSSSINDGASALVLASGNKAKKLNSPILAKVIAYADAATAPIDFTIAPSLAIPLLLKKAGLSISDIAKWEINEAFAAVSLANNAILGLDASKVNVKGGAIALGHPVGSSGSRILVTLINSLKEGEYGVAALCNGGGASTSVLVKKMSKVEE